MMVCQIRWQKGRSFGWRIIRYYILLKVLIKKNFPKSFFLKQGHDLIGIQTSCPFFRLTEQISLHLPVNHPSNALIYVKNLTIFNKHSIQNMVHFLHKINPYGFIQRRSPDHKSYQHFGMVFARIKQWEIVEIKSHKSL